MCFGGGLEVAGISTTAGLSGAAHCRTDSPSCAVENCGVGLGLAGVTNTARLSVNAGCCIALTICDG